MLFCFFWIWILHSWSGQSSMKSNKDTEPLDWYFLYGRYFLYFSTFSNFFISALKVRGRGRWSYYCRVVHHDDKTRKRPKLSTLEPSGRGATIKNEQKFFLVDLRSHNFHFSNPLQQIRTYWDFTPERCVFYLL